MTGDLGLVGCKLGPIYQNVDPLGPEFLRVCEALERLELPMLIHQGTTFARAGSLLQARPILLDEIALRYPELRIVIAHMGHPWFDEAIAVVRRHPHVYADVSALVARRWLLYQALVAAIEYRVDAQAAVRHRLPVLHGAADDRRPALGHGRRRSGRDMPAIDPQVVEDIIHRPSLELLGDLSRRSVGRSASSTRSQAAASSASTSRVVLGRRSAACRSTTRDDRRGPLDRRRPRSAGG